MELSLELGKLADVFKARFVEFDLLVRHNSTDLISLRCIVQTVGHLGQNLLDFLIFVMELVSLWDVCLEE